MPAMRQGGGDSGQAAVEVALVLPVVALLALLLVQVGLLVRAQVLVVHAAREAARASAVSEQPSAAREAAERGTSLDPGRLDVVARVAGPRRTGATVTAEVRYRAITDVPLVGRLVGDVELTGKAAMRVE